MGGAQPLADSLQGQQADRPGGAKWRFYRTEHHRPNANPGTEPFSTGYGGNGTKSVSASTRRSDDRWDGVMTVRQTVPAHLAAADRPQVQVGVA